MALQGSRTIYPHVALRSCWPAILYDIHRHFIHVDDMIIKEPAMEAVVQMLQITVGCLDRPSAHVLCRDEDAVILEFFCQAVDRLCIHILIVVDACNERWRGDTVPEKVCRPGAHMIFLSPSPT